MKRREIPARRLAGGALLVLLLFAWVPVGEAAYVILKGDRRIEGTKIRAKRDGTVTIETEKGPLTFAPGQYIRAVADQPPEISQAQKLVAQEQYDKAIVLLEKVATDYRHLEWDVQALKLLPQVQARKKDYPAAVTAYEKYMKVADAPDADVSFGYYEALLATKAYDKLELKLNEAIAKGPRDEAARAQIMRGDIRVAQNQLENAVLDYMRTAILFEAQKDVQPEALFKTATTLEKLRDPRAKDFYSKVVSKYPSSSYASQAKAKL